jgi:hypothetical protein
MAGADYASPFVDIRRAVCRHLYDELEVLGVRVVSVCSGPLIRKSISVDPGEPVGLDTRYALISPGNASVPDSLNSKGASAQD